jgi:hypothetical protein
VFKSDCRPTFRVEYLPAGAIPHCIDFILASEAIKAEGTTLLFTEKVLPGGAHGARGPFNGHPADVISPAERA